jgi:hypothetical protein
MKIKTAKRNPVDHVTTFYAPSETNPGTTYMVVRIVTNLERSGRFRKTQWFCQCDDFFGRKLPHLNTNTFSGCKHIKAAKEAA